MTKKFLFLLINITISLLIGACVFCWILSVDLGYHLVSSYSVVIFGIPFPVKMYTFHIIKMINLLFSPEINKIYLALEVKILIPFVVSGFVWLVLYGISARIIRAMINKRTNLHGSSRWATTKELEKRGMVGGLGIVLGETNDAQFKQIIAPPPKKQKDESSKDYAIRKQKEMGKVKEVLKTEGQLITQNNNAHTLVVGSTRSGKGVSCIIPTEFNWAESMIILDPKAEGWEISGNYRSKFSYAFKFQPENPTESIHYNPLTSVRRGAYAIADIQNLSTIIIPVNEQSKDPFWDNEARKLLTTIMGYVLYCEPPEKKNFKQVYSLITQPLENYTPDENDEPELKLKLRNYANNCRTMAKKMEKERLANELPTQLKKDYERINELPPNKQKEVKKLVDEYNTQNSVEILKKDQEAVERFAQDMEYFANCEIKQLSSVVSTMQSNLTVIADPNVQAITDRSDFVMEDFVNGIADEQGNRHPLSLYLCVSLSSMTRLTPLLKIFYEQAITLLTRELDTNRKYRLLLVFDEFRQMGKMDIVEKALSLSAGYGILCLIVIQSYDQLKVLYQSEAMFIDNFAYQVILKVNDISSCERIEKILGKATVKHLKMNTSGDMNQFTHKNESMNIEEIGRALMTADEIRSMPDDVCLIISSTEHPYKAKKVKYYLDERFRQKYLSSDKKKLPCPVIEDNYPHPECVKDKVRYGIDSEGWMNMVGYKSVEPIINEEQNKPEILLFKDTVPEVKEEFEPINENLKGADLDELFEKLNYLRTLPISDDTVRFIHSVEQELEERTKK